MLKVVHIAAATSVFFSIFFMSLQLSCKHHHFLPCFDTHWVQNPFHDHIKIIERMLLPSQCDRAQDYGYGFTKQRSDSRPSNLFLIFALQDMFMLCLKPVKCIEEK